MAWIFSAVLLAQIRHLNQAWRDTCKTEQIRKRPLLNTRNLLRASHHISAKLGEPLASQLRLNQEPPGRTPVGVVTEPHATCHPEDEPVPVNILDKRLQQRFADLLDIGRIVHNTKSHHQIDVSGGTRQSWSTEFNRHSAFQNPGVRCSNRETGQNPGEHQSPPQPLKITAACLCLLTQPGLHGDPECGCREVLTGHLATAWSARSTPSSARGPSSAAAARSCRLVTRPAAKASVTAPLRSSCDSPSAAHSAIARDGVEIR